MRMIPFESESLAAGGYDEARSVLRLRFQAGGIYDYANVPKFVWDALRDADSKGRYFQDEIRDQFPYHRVT